MLLHFNLKHPFMIGKKKFKDVQFFTVSGGLCSRHSASSSMISHARVNQYARTKRIPNFNVRSPNTHLPPQQLQLAQEVVSASQALDGRHRSDFDADELGEEERERKLRNELNRAFKKFVERVEEIAKVRHCSCVSCAVYVYVYVCMCVP